MRRIWRMVTHVSVAEKTPSGCFGKLSMQDGQPPAAGTWAMAYLAIGDRGRALEWLDRAIEEIEHHEPDAGWWNLMIIKHNLTGDPLLEEDDFSRRRTRIRGS